MENPKRVYTREQLIEAIDASLDYSSDHLLDANDLLTPQRNTGRFCDTTRYWSPQNKREIEQPETPWIFVKQGVYDYGSEG